MANPQELLASRVQDGLAVAFGEAYRDTDPLIRPSQHADFQANVALSLARRLGRPPREVAAELANALDVTDVSLAGPLVVAEKAERDLALKLLGFGPAVQAVGSTAEPHRLCTYLFELASQFTVFYENCPVLKADDDAVRSSRLALCALTLRALLGGLGLLGVPVPERM